MWIREFFEEINASKGSYNKVNPNQSKWGGVQRGLNSWAIETRDWIIVRLLSILVV